MVTEPSGAVNEASVLKIQRSLTDRVVFRLSGRIELEDVDELRGLFSLEGLDHPVALDLQDVTLVDREGVSFLSDCEAGGVKLENCPGYLRQWIERCRSSNNRDPFEI